MKRLVRCLMLAASVCVIGLPAAPAGAANAGQAKGSTVLQEKRVLKIRIEMNGTPVMVTLDDNKTSRDFVSLLPLRLTLDDYGDMEKVAYLPRKLTTDGAPPGVKPHIGDFTYYAPWGNLAIFHKEFRHSTGLIKLGRIDAGIEAFRRVGPVAVTVTLADR